MREREKGNSLKQSEIKVYSRCTVNKYGPPEVRVPEFNMYVRIKERSRYLEPVREESWQCFYVKMAMLA